MATLKEKNQNYLTLEYGPSIERLVWEKSNEGNRSDSLTPVQSECTIWGIPVGFLWVKDIHMSCCNVKYNFFKYLDSIYSIIDYLWVVKSSKIDIIDKELAMGGKLTQS